MMKKFFMGLTILILSLSIFTLPVFAESESAGIDLDCVREQLLSGGDTSICEGVGGGGTSEDINTNFFGIDFTADQAGAAQVVRTFITVALGLLVIGSIFYGIYGIYVRSTAGTDENKMKESVAIFKNAMLAVLITIGGIVLVELLSLFLGLGNVWEFTFSLNGASTSTGKFAHCPTGEERRTDPFCLVNDGTENTPRYCTYEYISGSWVKTSNLCIE